MITMRMIIDRTIGIDNLWFCDISASDNDIDDDDNNASDDDIDDDDDDNNASDDDDETSSSSSSLLYRLAFTLCSLGSVWCVVIRCLTIF